MRLLRSARLLLRAALPVALGLPVLASGESLKASDLIDYPRQVLGGSIKSVIEVVGKPSSVSRKSLTNRHDAQLTDEIVSLEYSWGSVSIYRAMVGSEHERELPFGVTVAANVPQLPQLPRIGANRADTRADLGSPMEETSEVLRYQLYFEGESQPDFMTFRFSNNALVEISWTFGVD